MTASDVFAEKRLIEIEAATLCRWLAIGHAALVDVREKWEFEQDRIPGSVNMPLSKFDPAGLPDLDGRRLVLVCAVGRRSAQAAGILLASGFDEVVHLRGGLLAWDEEDYATAPGAIGQAAEADMAAGLGCA